MLGAVTWQAIIATRGGKADDGVIDDVVSETAAGAPAAAVASSDVVDVDRDAWCDLRDGADDELHQCVCITSKSLVSNAHTHTHTQCRHDLFVIRVEVQRTVVVHRVPTLGDVASSNGVCHAAGCWHECRATESMYVCVCRFVCDASFVV